MEERTVISQIIGSNGDLVGRMVASPMTEVYMYETLADYAYTEVSVRVIDAGYSVDESYYETNTEGPINYALTRFMDSHYGDRNEAVETFLRYMRVFRPLSPVVVKDVQTGYSQGDHVTLCAFKEEKYSSPIKNEAPYQTAAREHEECESALEISGALARNQFWNLEREDIRIDGIVSEGLASVHWDGTDDLGMILCLKEFTPWKELRNVAGDLLESGETLEDAEYVAD